LNILCPKLSRTKIGNVPWEWIPESFDDFLEECENVTSHCKDSGHVALFRGQRKRKWLLDSTFVRSCKQNIFGMESWQKLRFEDFRLSEEHQQVLLNLFLFKFDFVAFPSQQLKDLELVHGIDPWFEFMKRLQQYAEEDTSHLKGSFILDWTKRVAIAIYFANQSRNGEGAVWICDVTATGKTLQIIKVKQILEKMAHAGKHNASLGIPLIFYPRKQLLQKRATNQEAVYIAQMDLRVDLSEVWDNLQKHHNNGEQIFIKVVLPGGTSEECARYLNDKGITREFVFPE
jgi:FRG domain